MIAIRELSPSELGPVGDTLPLNRLRDPAGASAYLIAWQDDQPIGHAHVAWEATHLGVPEIQDVFVLPDRRRSGVATQLTHAAEERARERGWTAISLSVSDRNAGARLLYEQLGYTDAGVAPVHVSGTVELRSGPLEVDDTLVYLKKAL